MDDYTQEYNKRQFNLMLYKISEYENKKISLKSLSCDLEGLLGVLHNKVPNEWVYLFQSNLGVLDDVHADMVDRGQTEMDNFRSKLIADALHELRQHVEEMISQID